MDDSRENFQSKLRSWFQNKGIIDKLVLYLRSQMFIELQNHSNKMIRAPENDSISPKLQAVKLLIADFLLQENLLFALSVFCSEVPVLLNLKQYTDYVSQLANLHTNASIHLKQPKPKFTRSDIHDILEALGLRLTKDEISIIHQMYKSEKFNSLLFCLLYLLPILLKKNRNFHRLIIKIRKREKHLKKVIRLEKIKVKRMYSLLQNTHGIVLKHKTEMNHILQKQNEIYQHSSLINEKMAEISKKETELSTKEEYLSSKEKNFEKLCQAKMEEMEKKSFTLTEKNIELQNNYKKLSEDQKIFNTEKELWLEKTHQVYSARTYETVQLQEYEQKFRSLQEEVFEILKQCKEVQNKRNMEADKLVNKEIQCRFDIINQSQQTEANDALNLEEYVNLMEKENTLLKSSSFKQRHHIAQLSTEIVFLKNRLDYLEKELQINAQFQRRKEMNAVAEKLYSPKFLRLEKDLSASSSRIRKKLFPDKESPSTSEFTNSNSKEDNSLTDELVADAKNKLKELENESEALNKNFKNLQTVLSKNISFNEKAYSSSDSSSDKVSRKYASSAVKLSPRFLSSNLYDNESNLRSSPDLRTRSVPFLKKNFPSDTISPFNEIRGSPDRSMSFRRMYLKYKQSKRKEQTVNTDDEKKLVEEIEADKIYQSSIPNVDENLNSINEPDDIEKNKTPSDQMESSPDVDIFNKGANSFEGHQMTPFSHKDEVSGINNAASVRSSSSSVKNEGEISAASKDSKSSSDFWK